MSSTGEGVGQKVRSGISWNFAGSVATNATRIAVVAILGRTLSSQDFGIVAAAISVNVILYGVRDLGIATALIQRKHLEAGHLSTAFAVSAYIGMSLCLLVFFAAPAIGDLYGIPASTDVLRVLSVQFLLLGISTPSRAICLREMRFRTITAIETSAFVIGSSVSITAAIAGVGPWALVAGYCVEELLNTSLYLWRSPPSYSLRIDRSRLRDLMTVGVGQTIAQVAGIVATYGDNFIVGRVLGAQALGVYTRAYDLVKFPSTVFGNIVGLVLSPAFARLQDDPERLAVNFRRVLFLNALVLLPASAALMTLAPEAIRILMGPGWQEAVLPFQVLSATILLRTTQKLGAIVSTAAGAVNGVAFSYVVYAILVISGASFSVRWGVLGVAITTSIAICTVNVMCCYFAMKVSHLDLASVLRAHVPGLILAGLVAGAAWPFTLALRSADLSAGIIFGLVAGAAILVSLLVSLFWLWRAVGDFGWLREQLHLRRARSNH